MDDLVVLEPDVEKLPTSQARRWCEGIAFVAVWMGLNWGFKLGPNESLLVGVPLTVVFQRVVRRQPIRALWVREAPAWGNGWLVPATCLAILPTFRMVQMLGKQHWVVGAWYASAVVGAVGAGYALKHFRRETVRPFLYCIGTAGFIGIAVLVTVRQFKEPRLPIAWLSGLEYLLLYFPICFALEEVSFRGALDSHLWQPGDRFRISSALVGSALWGLWHLPVAPTEAKWIGPAIVLIVMHCLTGVPFAFFWRKSGNLVVPAFTHALIDAVRNALRLMG